MNYSLLLISLLVLITSRLTEADAAIVQQQKVVQPSSESSSIQVPAVDRQEENCHETATNTTSKSVLAGIKKFALLTTGRQVKLQPLADDDQISGSPYFIKIFDQLIHGSEIELDHAANHRALDTGVRNKPPILPKGLDRTRNLFAAKASIIPSNDDDFLDDGIDYWISDVNYIFDSRYCPESKVQSSDECMVVTWLDTMRQQIGFASVDLRLRSDELHRHKTIYAVPRKYIGLSHSKNGYLISSDSGLVVDRKRQELYANLQTNDGLLAVLAKFKLDIASEMKDDYWSSGDLDSCLPLIRVQNLNFDEGNGGWFFYSHFNGTRSTIGAISLSSCQRRFDHAIVAEVAKSEESDRFGVSGIAPDPASRRIYWLTEDNDFMSCNFDGSDVAVVNRFSKKLLIKRPDRTEVVRDTFYISDSRRRLFHQKLAAQNDGLRMILIEDHLENFRIGYVNHTRPACNNTNGSNQDDEKNLTKIDLVESKRNSVSLQSSMDYLASLLEEDAYDILKGRSMSYCDQGSMYPILDRWLFIFPLIVLVASTLIRCYVGRPAQQEKKKPTKDHILV